MQKYIVTSGKPQRGTVENRKGDRRHRHFGGSCGSLRGSWRVLGWSWGVLGRSWGNPGEVLGGLVAILGAQDARIKFSGANWTRA